MGVQAISTGSWEDVLGVRYWTGTQWIDAFDPRMNVYYYSRRTTTSLSSPNRTRWTFPGFRSQTSMIPTSSTARGSIRTGNLKIVNLHVLIGILGSLSSLRTANFWTCEIDGIEITTGVVRTPQQPVGLNPSNSFIYIVYPLPSIRFSGAANRGFTMTREGNPHANLANPEGYTYVSAVSA